MMESASCKSVQSALWEYVEGTLARDDRNGITIHLTVCQECRLYGAEIRSMRTGLKRLPAKAIPPLLKTKLDVIASRERSRRLIHLDLSARMRDLRSRVKLFFDNLLRPLAVPATGGILASIFCFGVIVDALHVRPNWQNDMPVGLFTQVTIDDLSPFCFRGKDVMVQLTIDERGNVSDFSIPQGDISSDEIQEIGNLVLFTSFSPATAFGQPVTGKVLVNIHHISIRG